MTWEYTTEYNKLLDILDQDTRPWRPIALIPEDGTKVYIRCSLDRKGDTLYDVGAFDKHWYCPDGEWNTSFGNMEECTGWKLFEEKE